MSDTISLSSEEEEGISDEFGITQNYRGRSKIRRFFRRYSEGARIYNQCLIRHCTRRIAGYQTCNLKRHLRRIHNIESLTKSTENLIATNKSMPRAETAETSKLPKYFSTFREDGKIMSICLVNGCERRIAGHQTCNLKRHLRLVHKITLMSKHSVRSNNRNQSGLAAPAPPNNAVQSQIFRTNTVNMSKYFECITEHGRQYSICLKNFCRRRFDGNHIDTLQNHLDVVHGMNLCSASTDDLSDEDDQNQNDQFDENASRHLDENLSLAATQWTDDPIGEATGNVTPVDCGSNAKTSNGQEHIPEASTSTAGVLLNTVINKQKRPFYSRSTLNYRKYFKIISERDRIYCKCLIKGCDRRMSGKFSGNLYRHLRLVHGAKSWPTGGPRENIHGNSYKPSEWRKYFQTFKQNGKIVSKCLFNNCGRHLAGKMKCNLVRHLRKVHQIYLMPESTENPIDSNASDPESELNEGDIESAQNTHPAGFRKHFSTVSANGRTVSKRLINGCEQRIAGQMKCNLRSNHPNQSDPLLMADTRTCRLCFEDKDDVIDIFSDELTIANVIRLHFASDEVNENDLLPKFVCSACWLNLENFHKFYLGVNRAKDKYLEKSMETYKPNLCDIKTEPIDVSCKDEPIEYVITDSNDWQQEENAIEGFVDEATNDKQDFDAVFCEEFISDFDTTTDDVKDRPPIELNAEHSEYQESVSSSSATREKSDFRKKSECMSIGDCQISRKRSANYSERDLVCEFCEYTFSTQSEMEMHYQTEHIDPGGQTKLYEKRVKR